MRTTLLRWLPIFLLAGRGPGAEGTGPKWTAFADASRHFRLQHPPAWKTTTQVQPVTHYRTVFLALNSAGKAQFVVQEQQTAPGTWEFNARTIASQLPPGSAYLDIGWWDGPGPLPRFGPGIKEMGADDLSALLPKAVEQVSPDKELVTRAIEFNKWGRRWSLCVYFHAPVTPETRQEMDRVLASFRFDPIPAGDEIWAIGEARRHLPAAAEPDKFIREGTMGFRTIRTAKEGQDVLVTFTKEEPGQAKAEWRYRVTAAGKVVAFP